MTNKQQYAELLARSYDSIYGALRDPSGDIEFYVEEATRSGGPVLEVGCGTGRVLLPTAQTGVECVGLDASPEMLDVFRKKNPPGNVELVVGNMGDFSLGDGRFRLVTAPFRALQHLLDVEAQLQALANIKRHLVRGGAFVFDVFDPNPAMLAVAEEPESNGVVFEYEGQPMRRREKVWRDLSTQVIRVQFRLEGGPDEMQGTTEVKLRWFYRYELEHLLARAGFKDMTFYEGFKRCPWQSGKNTVVVAKT